MAYTTVDLVSFCLFAQLRLSRCSSLHSTACVVVFSNLRHYTCSLNNKCLFSCRYQYCSQYFPVNNVHYISTLIIIMFIIFNTIQCYCYSHQYCTAVRVVHFAGFSKKLSIGININHSLSLLIFLGVSYTTQLHRTKSSSQLTTGPFSSWQLFIMNK